MPIHDAGDLFGSVCGVQTPARSGARSAPAVLGPIRIVMNGEYLPAQYGFDGFDSVTVAIPPMYVQAGFRAWPPSSPLTLNSISPADGSTSGETLIEFLNERASYLVANGFPGFITLFDIPNIGNIVVPARVLRKTQDESGNIIAVTITGGEYDAQTNNVSLRLETSVEGGNVLSVVGAAGMFGSMAIDETVASQLVSSARYISLMLMAHGK